MSDYSNLIEKYVSVLKQDPQSRVFVPLGEIYRKLGLYEKANALFESGLKYNPDYNLAVISYSSVLIDTEEYQKAYDLLRPFQKQNGDNIKFLKNIAVCADKIGNIEEALKFYKIILFFNPRDTYASDYVSKYEDRNIDVIKKDAVLFDVDKIDGLEDGWKQLNLIDGEKNSEVFDNEDSHDNWQQFTTDKIVKAPEPVVHRVSTHSDLMEEDETEIEEVIHFNQVVDSKKNIIKVKDEDTEIKKEAPKAPLFSHTLVDLYLKQGLREKALEILESALEINPNDERVVARIEEVKAEIQSKSGHDDLMKMFDQKTSKLKILDENKENKTKMYLELFLNKIHSRAKEVTNI